MWEGRLSVLVEEACSHAHERYAEEATLQKLLNAVCNREKWPVDARQRIPSPDFADRLLPPEEATAIWECEHVRWHTCVSCEWRTTACACVRAEDSINAAPFSSIVTFELFNQGHRIINYTQVISQIFIRCFTSISLKLIFAIKLFSLVCLQLWFICLLLFNEHFCCV